MARRFITDEVEVNGEEIEIYGEEAKHIFVLRHKKGDNIEVNNILCEIITIDKDRVICKFLKKVTDRGIPKIKITLFQGLLKGDKTEYVIQKAVETGVYKVVPFLSKNTVVKVNDIKDKIKKQNRFNKIAKEAVKQSGRTDEVVVEMPITLAQVIDELEKYDKIILAYENEKKSLKETLKGFDNPQNIAIIIGPEGGFDISEIQDISKKNNIYSVSLGERILRSETAGVVLLSILSYEFSM